MVENPDFIRELPEFLKPRLRLFLSVDIVNSTAFKQKTTWIQTEDDSEAPRHKGAEDWFEPIGAFYYELGRIFFTRWHHLTTSAYTKLQWPKGQKPELWKAAGDELLYSVYLTDYRQALVCIQALIFAVNERRVKLREKYRFLDLKASAWLAGFPINNTEVIILSDPTQPEATEFDGDAIQANFRLMDRWYSVAGLSPPHFRDFIGPSMDTGFRIAAQSSARKMAISADLALMLAFAGAALQRTIEADKSSSGILAPDIFYDGRITLKGVNDGAPYPIFWLDTADGDSLVDAEDMLAAPKGSPSDAVKRFCELFLTELGERHMPFILDSEEPFFRQRSAFHERRLKSYLEYWKNEGVKREVEIDISEPRQETAPPEAEITQAVMAGLSASALRPAASG